MALNNNKESSIPSIYTLDEIERVTNQPNFNIKLIKGTEKGFIGLENGDFFACPIQTMGISPFPFVETEGYAAQTCVKSGYFRGEEYYLIKVASGGYPHSNSGLMQVYSQRTGKLEALLLDDGLLTEIRTAAAGALAAKILAPKNIQTIGIVGTGVQSRYQLQMLRTIIDCRNILVWGRTASNVQEFCAEMSQKGWNITTVDEIDVLLKECQLIITVTSSRDPLLGLNLSTLPSPKKGLHITCMGADAPGKIELAPELVGKADLLVADTIQQSVERGEFQKAVSDGLIQQNSIISLGKLLEMSDLHRKNDDNRITIFDSSGVALQDCVVSQMVYNALRNN